ncbi:hypothetical protein [Mycobacterium sp. 236(2023)]|uniref:hypothetical protein n=1 Tax=Mycobacterium sp. 236(2023) TaxID=3038163 RepID=UPI0024150C73|nr:hypothetical protein [Mycobacterium sp. 236(2023)]MDG4669187.1 hypothetical protein [Mycobacterium sp. 236(2023)]
MLDTNWKDQYKRMQRAFDLLKQAADETSTPHIDPRDVLTDFCAEVLSLMYWVQKSTGTADPRGLVFKNRQSADWSVAIAICADIANGAKHHGNTQTSAVTAEKSGWADIKEQRIRKKMAQTWGTQRTVPGYSTVAWTLEADGIEYDALTVATQAVDDWDTWLAANGFRIPPPPVTW